MNRKHGQILLTILLFLVTGLLGESWAQKAESAAKPMVLKASSQTPANMPFAPPASAGTEPAPRLAAAGNGVPAGGKNLPQQAPQVPQISIEKAIQQIQAYLNDSKRQVTFERDESTDRTVIKVIDPASGDIIRQFPSEEVLKIAAIIDAQGFRTVDELA